MKCLILAVVVLLACVGKTHAASAEVDIGLGYSHLSLDGSERFKDRDGVRVEPRISFAPSESRPELRLGFGLGISGYSQGGQASSWAAELQAKYAPELNVKGVLTGGVPSDMVKLVNHLDGNPTGGAGFALASLVGLDFAHPELALEDRLTPEGQQVIDRVKDSCYVEDFATFGTTTTGEVTEPDVLSDSAWIDRYSRSTLGTTAPRAPTYVYHGTLDTIVPFALGKEMFHSWCERGATSTFEALPGLEHLSGNTLGPTRGLDWLVDRLHGIEAEPGCHELEP